MFTAIGLFLTLGSHWIAGKLIVLQRADKVEAQNRLKVSEKELENTKLKTAELEKRLAPRVLTNEQRQRFLEFVANSPKGKVRLKCIANDKEAWAYAISLKDLLTTAGFDVASEMLMFISSGDGAIGVRMAIKNADHPPPFAGDIQRGFESIGIRTPAFVEASNEGLSEDMVEIRVGAKT